MKRNRSRRRRWLVLGISVAVLAAAAAVATQLTSSSAEGSPVIGVTNIDLHDEAFSPPVIQVTQGATVTWKFSDGGTEHNIVGEGWGWGRDTTVHRHVRARVHATRQVLLQMHASLSDGWPRGRRFGAWSE